jgi:hypothetical protein
VDADKGFGQVFRGPGGAVMNYTQTTFGGQISTMQMITSGALDQHPGLCILVSEGGATWGPFLGDRMNEGRRITVGAFTDLFPEVGDPPADEY